MKRYAAAAVLISILALGAASATAAKAKAPHRYALRHGSHCRPNYKRVKHGKRVYCVKRAVKKSPATPPASPLPATAHVKLHAHLDPAFTRNPLNPFLVTYAYSASATEQTFAESTPISGESEAPLPSGVLSFFSDGKLECAINVGSGVSGSECPVTYQALGEHRVTTIYTSGEQSATETEAEVIQPMATETTLDLAYEGHEGGPEDIEEAVECHNFYLGQPMEGCEYTYKWEIGTVAVTASSNPAGAVSLSCDGGWCAKEGVLDGSAQVELMLSARGYLEGPTGTIPHSPTCAQVKQSTGRPGFYWREPANSTTITASPTAPGYALSVVTRTLEFAPVLPC